ncbi:MAG: response regulator [Spirochaetaceae bacterium]|nr:response regulator [Spirochaetaceae bacterium]
MLSHKSVYADKGRVSISQELFEQGIVDIEGEWEFFWDEFIQTGHQEAEEYIVTTSNWRNLHNTYGSASYRLILTLPAETESISLRYGQIYSCFTLFANGKLVDQQGDPNIVYQQSRPSLRYPKIITITDPGEQLELIFHVSNPNYRRNGINALSIARTDLMSSFQHRTLADYSFGMGLIFALTLFHFLIALQRKKQPHVLFFAFFCLTLLLKAYFINTQFIFISFPQLNMAFFDRFQRLAIYPISGLFVSYISAFFPSEQRKIPLRISQAASLFFLATAFILPLKWVSTYAMELFIPFVLLAVIYSFYVLILAIRHQREDAWPVIIGFILYFITLFLDIFINREILFWQVDYIRELGVLAFLFFQSYAISQRQNRAFTNEKNLRQLLQGVQSRLELVVHGANLGLVEWNITQDQWFVNDNFYKILGYRDQEKNINGLFWLDLVHPKERRALEYSLEGLREGDIQDLHKEFSMLESNGTYKWVLLIGRIIKTDKQGRPHWFSSLIIDVSEKKQTEDSLNLLVHQRTLELERAQRESEIANRAKSTFLANMSHEIRTPINGVTGMAEMLLEGPLNDTQREYAQVIFQSSQSLLSIINDILDFSRIDSQPVELESRPFDLMLVSEEIIQMLQGRAEDQGLDLFYSFDQSAPKQVWGDEEKIRQILTNILGNAIKFTPKGHVMLDIQWEKMSEKRGRYTFNFLDTGIGISKENQKRIFDNFMQGDISTTRIYGGSGLGLTISRQLIEMMGGDLQLNSQEGQGTDFFFSLELEYLPDSSWDLQLNEIKQRNPIIIIAGASHLQCSIIKRYAELWELEIHFVQRALEVINLSISNGEYFLILADHLPDMTAEDLVKSLREDHKNWKIIMQLNVAEMKQQDDFLKAGADLLLLKPLLPSRIISILSGKNTAALLGDSGDSQGKNLSAHILIAEDNKFNQRVVMAMLNKMGCSYELAENGYEVLDLLRDSTTKHFDLVLMDCHMPLLDGYKTTGLLRLFKGEVASIPVVALTANALSSDRQKCLDSGMDDYIAKPVNMAGLREKLMIYLKDKNLSDPEEPLDVLMDRRRLLHMVGSEESMDEMVTLFMDQTSIAMGELENLLPQGTYDELIMVAHRVKGMAGNAGAVQLCHTASDLEKALSSNEDRELIYGYVFELKRQWQALREEIGSY